MGESKKSYSPRIHGGNVKKYVIVQNRIEVDEDGTPKVNEVVLAYPDSEKNATRRLFRWRRVLEMENIRIREATKEDYPKKRKKKGNG